MFRIRLPLASLLVGVAIATMMRSIWPCVDESSTSDPPDRSARFSEDGPPLTSFQLTRQDGTQLDSAHLRGHVWVASYFFTRCGANCRMLNMEIARLQRQYGPLGVKFVSLTCDPLFDTPPVLSQYATLLNADSEHWIFATGDMGYLKRVGHDVLHVSVVERSHDAQLTIVDQQGKVRGTFQALDPDELRLAKQTIEELCDL